MSTSPIAIVGSSCVLPGALSPEQLWDAVVAGKDLLSTVPEDRWRLAPERALCDPAQPQPDRAWSDRGGYVRGFEAIWNPAGFALPAAQLQRLDRLNHWLLHCARQARDGVAGNHGRTGAIIGNLGFPSESMAAYADQVWRDDPQAVDPRNRYMSGGSAEVLAQALELDAGSYCLDAACASSLYAIKLACDKLADGDADLMLAGAVQRADDLFLHIGFSALNALSRSGQSRPFHRDADGLVPAEGCAVLALKRLADARRDGDHIHAVIRGIGLSNDGRGRGLLVPDQHGQQRAIRAAYSASGIDPSAVSLLECHATGTPVGDGAELTSSAAVFGGAADLPIASLKANLGHLITSAGAAGIIKLCQALKHRTRPPNVAVDQPLELLQNGPFRLLQKAEEWTADGPRIAAISAFGFGGNNAHLILSEDDRQLPIPMSEPTRTAVAIVGIGALAGAAANRAQLAEAVAEGRLVDGDGQAAMSQIELDLAELRFPPSDLQQTLPQQLAMLEATRQALAEVDPLPRKRSAVLIGMEPDPEVARYGSRWRADEQQRQWADSLIAPLQSPGVVGCMPNIPANRISSQYDLAGPAYTLQAGPASGLQALRIAVRAIANDEIDAAIVGAVDLGCEPVNQRASGQPGTDAAIALVLKSVSAAEAAGDRIYAIVDPFGDDDFPLLPQWRAELGNAGAADALLRIATGALSLHHRRLLDGTPWLAHAQRGWRISADTDLALSEARAHSRRSDSECAQLHVYSGTDRGAVIAALRANQTSNDGPARLVLVARESELEALRDRALAHLLENVPAGAQVHYRDAPISGELAFAYAGAGAAYRGMGESLLLQLPQLQQALAERSEQLACALDWALQADGPDPSVAEQLWGASALAQLHSELTLNLLGLQPDAWLGYSSGETNALVAAGVWPDADGLAQDMANSELLSHQLGGEFTAVRELWQEPVDWRCWTIAAPLALVREALASEKRAHLAIINSDQDCLIAGDASACERVVSKIGTARCLPLEYCLAVHVPEVAAVAERWRKLHQRHSHPARCGRIYSSAHGAAYDPDTASCAEAILDQATQTLDMRKVVLQAYEDGVRVFVEHGPGGGFGRAVREILGQREALVVSLDRRGRGFEATLHAIAALVAAGVPVDLEQLHEALRAQPPATKQRPFSLPAHWPAVSRPAPEQQFEEAVIAQLEVQPELQIMQPAPALPGVCMAGPRDQGPGPSGTAEKEPNRTAEKGHRAQGFEAGPSGMVGTAGLDAASLANTPSGLNPSTTQPSSALVALWRNQLAQLSAQQQAHEQALAQAHQNYLSLQGQAQQLLLSAASGPATNAGDVASAGSVEYPQAQPPTSTPSAAADQPAAKMPVSRLAPNQSAVSLDRPAEQNSQALATPAADASPVAGDTPRGPQFDRQQLEVHADGAISSLFGPEFAAQDDYFHQVRMPQPPLLLTDRVLGIEGAAGSMGKGRIWTETDVGSQGWYLHQARMPAGVMIEAGQADLMLISWLGIDALNRGERVYRLLGCELTYHGDLPKLGDTLRFDIHIDGHAAQGDVRLMFFHYDSLTRSDTEAARPQLSVRDGQAGFFTAAELADSAGCLWSAEQQEINPTPRLDPPATELTRHALSREQLEAYAGGDAYGCFGEGFEFARTHTRSPGVHGERMLLLDRITELSIEGGPWQRGYLRAELDIDPEQWFFDGHFKNDPCMPGTLMFEACLQAMAIYIGACGYTLRRDGWRFQPIPEQPYQLQCRGQVTPQSKRLITEIFVEERGDGPEPFIYADLLCTVDGLKAFHARRVGVQLVPDWPLEVEAPVTDDSDRPVAVVDGFKFDQQALLACALGRPSNAFGPMYQRYDGPTRVARLPSPPYHFISRIAEIEGPIGRLKAGARVVAEYDLPSNVWYLDENGTRKMPFAVLLEAALQPCGWLSSYVGSTLTVDEELGFRNLDGEGEVLLELSGGDGILHTEVTLTEVSASAGMIIEKFSVNCRLGEREVYRLKTVFGFFPPAALAAQAGLPVGDVQRELLQRKPNLQLDLCAEPAAYFDPQRPRLAASMLRMIDRIEGLWPDAGEAGLGQLRAVKDVDSDEWFFKAHFFQDPVQPGSLGLEAMLQTLQAFLLHQRKDAHVPNARFETIGLQHEHRWRYRGQVLPHHRQVHTTLELTAEGQDERGYYALADASLWVDGQRIYEASGLAVRIVSADK